MHSKELAIFGGNPIRKQEWSSWPIYNEDTLRVLSEVLKSKRWAISSNYLGINLFERLFAQKFAEFCSAKYCIPVDHGSSALLVSLEALDIGFGDEVIIPALTWVATASSVLNVNAIPVLVDVDPLTLCIDPNEVEKAITTATKAIIPVHLYCNICNMTALQAISKKYNISIIEDCSHSHGAEWMGQKVGTFGSLGTFSMQQSKLLTSGEGGAIITNDDDLFQKAEQYRADGRKHSGPPYNLYQTELVTNTISHGTNYCLSEFQSAILLNQLEMLDKQNMIRLKNAIYLDSLILQIPGLKPLSSHKEVTFRTYYGYIIEIDFNFFHNLDIIELCNILVAELNISVNSIYKPINKIMNYNPHIKKRFRLSNYYLEKLDLSNKVFPISEEASNTYILRFY